MTTDTTCPRCGARLAEALARGGRCPRCVLSLALQAAGGAPDPPDPDGLEEALDRPDAGEPEYGERDLGVAGPYRIVKPLGMGGMGVVYLAEQTEPIRRQVALKLIRFGFDSAIVMRRFEAERQALALMDHPAIARVLDAGVTDSGRPYFVMEYVAGEPVTHSCDRRRLTIRERLELFASICDGVQHAHRRGVIHRDLKPTNILVADESGRPVPKIIDFGIAKAIDRPLAERTLFTEMGVIVGTPAYMSPEQAALSAIEVDTRTDVYSLGVILYELLVGAQPFAPEELKAAGFDEMRRIIREDDPPAPSVRLSKGGADADQAARDRQTDTAAWRRQVHGDLDWITLKALEKDPGRRYESPADLGADVRRHLTDEVVEAGPPGTTYRMRKFVRRNKAMVGSVGLVFLALTAGTALATAFGLRETAQRRRADAALHDIEQVAEFQETMLSGVIAEEMGRRIVADLRTRGIKAQGKTNLEADSSAAELEIFDRFTARVNATDAALRAIDEEILGRAAAALEGAFEKQPLVKARLAHTIGRAYMELGLLDRASPHLTQAEEIRERILGRKDRATLESIDAQAVLLTNQGSYEQAEPLLLEVLEACRRTLGPDDPQTLATMSDLALLYLAAGRNDEAEALQDRVLDVRLRALGPTHEETLTAKNNLAETYRAQGRFEEAERLQVEVLESRRRTLGDEHPDTLATMSNLANQYVSRGRYDLAEPLITEALATRRRVLGEEHQETLASLAVMAAVRLEAGRLEEAQALYEEDLEMTRRVLGREHPSTFVIMNNLARVLARRGRLGEAVRLDTENLEAKIRVLGPDHPDTLSSLSNLALDNWQAGRYPESVRLNLEAVERRRRVLGPAHPLTLLSLGNLAIAYRDQGNMEDAEAILREVYETAMKEYGLEDLKTLLPMGNLGELLIARGEAVEAERLLSQAAVAIRKVLPAGHVTLGVTLRKYGASLTALGRHQEAETVLLEAYDTVQKAAGTDGAQTLKVARDLADLYEAWGPPAKATRWRQAARPSTPPQKP